MLRTKALGTPTFNGQGEKTKPAKETEEEQAERWDVTLQKPRMSAVSKSENSEFSEEG